MNPEINPGRAIRIIWEIAWTVALIVWATVKGLTSTK